MEGSAVGFDCMTDFGALFARMPISSLCHREDAPELPLGHLQLWNNFSYDVEAHCYGNLRGLRCSTILKDRKWYDATYQFTLNWKGNNYSDKPGDLGFKRGHFLKLDNGCFAIQPNNRIKWFEPSFITRPFPDKPDFEVNQLEWNCEQGERWVTSDSSDFFYDI